MRFARLAFPLTFLALTTLVALAAQVALTTQAYALCRPGSVVP